MTDERLVRAKALLAQEIPVARVAREVGLPPARIRREARERGWLRRTRRDPYSSHMRVEALELHAQTGSMTFTARSLGIARRTLLRWLASAAPTKEPVRVEWRCYSCSPYGLKVEGHTCPGCGTIRRFE